MTHLRSKSRLGVVVGIGAAALLWARAPFALRNFWGEDGAAFFGQAMEDDWIEPLIRPLHGYFVFLLRVLGLVASFGPLEHAPAVMFALCALVTGWFAATIVLTGDRYLDRLWSRVTLAFLPVLLPIVGFESIANISGLHFLMFCAASAVLVGRQEGRGRQVNDVVLVTMVGLTSPLTLGLAPLAVLRIWWDRQAQGLRSPAPVVVGWAVGVMVQLAMIVTMIDEGEGRELLSDHSIPKTGFLFLERVVSYNLLPFWPWASQADSVSGIDGQLIVRAVVGLVVLSLLAAVVIRAAGHNQRRGATEKAELALVLPVIGGAFFLAGSMLIGPEPRYAVFPAFCIVWALLVANESFMDLEQIRPVSRVITAVIGVVMLMAVVTHWVPSQLRRSGPSWTDGLAVATEKCEVDPDDWIAVPILPDGWTVQLDCSDVLGR